MFFSNSIVKIGIAVSGKKNYTMTIVTRDFICNVLTCTRAGLLYGFYL